jgi:predicted DsbA family dithiol-disulfide isomerase
MSTILSAHHPIVTGFRAATIFIATAIISACAEAPAPMATPGPTPTAGATEPEVVVNVFCDYQCPACRHARGMVENVVTHFGGRVQVRYRQFPLTGTHPLARDAAVYALAAHRQGRFQCVHTSLYVRQDDWTELQPKAFKHFAEELAHRCGLDLARFERDVQDPALGQQVDDDAEIARDLGARGTPTIYVSGLEPERWPKPGVPHRRLMVPMLRQELREAVQLRESGVPLAELPARKILGNTGDPARVRALTTP